MITATRHDLYARGEATLLAAWQSYADASEGAAIVRLPGVVVAVFPTEPERMVYNNALLERRLDPDARNAAIDAMEDVYASSGVERFAAWVHETDEAMAARLTHRGYRLEEMTRAMGMNLEDIAVPRPELDLASPDLAEHCRLVGVPEGFLAAADPSMFHVLIARLNGRNVATALGYDNHGDCGLYNVGTLEHARRQGIGTALSALHLHDARSRGCTTATVQSTEMAERVYGALGFRDLGRVLEYVK